MKCAEFEKHVIEVTEQAPPQGLLESLEEHRRDCQSCALLAATIEQMLQEDLPTQDAALSEQFWPTLLERVQESEPQGLAFNWQALRPIALTACLLIVLWAGVHLGNAYVNKTMGSPTEIEGEIVPYLSVLDEVPHDSLTEVLLQESFQIETEQ